MRNPRLSRLSTVQLTKTHLPSKWLHSPGRLSFRHFWQRNTLLSEPPSHPAQGVTRQQQIPLFGYTEGLPLWREGQPVFLPSLPPGGCRLRLPSADKLALCLSAASFISFSLRSLLRPGSGAAAASSPTPPDRAGRRALPPARPSGAPPGSAWLRPPPPGPARQRRRGRQFPVPRLRAALGPQCHSAPGAGRAAAARPAPLRGTPAGSEQRRQPLGGETGQWPRPPLVRAPAETTTRPGVRSGCRGPGVRRGTSASLRTDVGAAQDSAPPPPPLESGSRR